MKFVYILFWLKAWIFCGYLKNLKNYTSQNRNSFHYDLFDYDVEVQPILNVLLNKSIEQATLEVEEEHELDQIRKFKIGYHKRRQAEDAEW